MTALFPLVLAPVGVPTAPIMTAISQSATIVAMRGASMIFAYLVLAVAASIWLYLLYCEPKQAGIVFAQTFIVAIVGGTAYDFNPETGLLAAGLIGAFVALLVTVLPLRVKWWLESRRAVQGGRPRLS